MFIILFIQCILTEFCRMWNKIITNEWDQFVETYSNGMQANTSTTLSREIIMPLRNNYDRLLNMILINSSKFNAVLVTFAVNCTLPVQPADLSISSMSRRDTRWHSQLCIVAGMIMLDLLKWKLWEWRDLDNFYAPWNIIF